MSTPTKTREEWCEEFFKSKSIISDDWETSILRIIDSITAQAKVEALESSDKVLKRVCALCEAYQNADIEGKDPDDIIDNADLVINQICEMATVELVIKENQTAELTRLKEKV